MLVNDFARELSKALTKRRDIYQEKVVKTLDARMAGHVDGLTDAINALESIRRDFLAKSDNDDEDSE